MIKVTKIAVPTSDFQRVSGDSISAFRMAMLTWYHQQGRHFPWRRTSLSNYKLVVSELLLQRTKAENVSRIFDRFFEEFPSWQSLSSASEVQIGESIQQLGIWRRRSSVLRELGKVMAKRNGRLPKEREEIESLPGIGQYISNAILLFCHGQPYPLLDVNMARVLERVFGPRKLADIRYDPYLQGLSFVVVQVETPRELNWAILDFAALVCRPTNPDCHSCPVSGSCKFFQGEKNV